MIDPAVAGFEEAYQVKTTIRDGNTLNDILSVTIYVYDDVLAHGYTKGTYDEVGSYGFQWDSGTWKELTASGWSTTFPQLVSANFSAPVLTGSQGEWLFEFKMNKMSRRTATTDGWKIEVNVEDDDAASDINQDLVWYQLLP